MRYTGWVVSIGFISTYIFNLDGTDSGGDVVLSPRYALLSHYVTQRHCYQDWYRYRHADTHPDYLLVYALIRPPTIVIWDVSSHLAGHSAPSRHVCSLNPVPYKGKPLLRYAFEDYNNGRRRLHRNITCNSFPTPCTECPCSILGMITSTLYEAQCVGTVRDAKSLTRSP